MDEKCGIDERIIMGHPMGYSNMRWYCGSSSQGGRCEVAEKLPVNVASISCGSMYSCGRGIRY
jgi:hypothetical protein